MSNTVYKVLEKKGRNPSPYSKNPKQPRSLRGYINQKLLNIYQETAKKKVSVRRIKEIDKNEEILTADLLFSEILPNTSWEKLTAYFENAGTGELPSEEEMIQMYTGISLFLTFIEVYGDDTPINKKYGDVFQHLSELKSIYCKSSSDSEFYTHDDLLDPLRMQLWADTANDPKERSRNLKWKAEAQSLVSKWRSQGYIDKGKRKSASAEESSEIFNLLFFGDFWKVGWGFVAIVAIIVAVIAMPKSSSTYRSNSAGSKSYSTQDVRDAAGALYDRCTANPNGPSCAKYGF
ncbi:MAG: hypothetical protein ACFE0S_10210 [Rhodospirillales bacterium]